MGHACLDGGAVDWEIISLEIFFIHFRPNYLYLIFWFLFAGSAGHGAGTPDATPTHTLLPLHGVHRQYTRQLTPCDKH